jgi:hypothetical protein
VLDGAPRALQRLCQQLSRGQPWGSRGGGLPGRKLPAAAGVGWGL